MSVFGRISGEDGLPKTLMGGNMDYEKIVNEAKEAMKMAYTPYSHFKVGAALVTEDDEIIRGCNVENAAYGPSNCAERTAFFKAVSEGKQSFKAIAIVGGPEGQIKDFCPPCGVCRQVMREFCNPKTFEIILCNAQGKIKVYTLEELLPESFGPENLD